MTAPKKRLETEHHTVDTIQDDLTFLVGEAAQALKAGREPRFSVSTLERLNRIWSSLNSAEREAARDKLADQLDAAGLEQLKAEALQWVQKGSKK